MVLPTIYQFVGLFLLNRLLFGFALFLSELDWKIKEENKNIRI